MTVSVHGEVAGDFGGAICFWWDDRHRTTAVQLDSNPIDVERLVCKQGAEDPAGKDPLMIPSAAVDVEIVD
ncbi:hypothetical protein [Magnetospirillum gryphiswaldense]|uniref:hypothetical protein n=1 Tax=Magnetospirillum gryphiswaldense TaxID=55518 RepID=UPI000D0439BB